MVILFASPTRNRNAPSDSVNMLVEHVEPFKQKRVPSACTKALPLAVVIVAVTVFAFKSPSVSTQATRVLLPEAPWEKQASLSLASGVAVGPMSKAGTVEVIVAAFVLETTSQTFVVPEQTNSLAVPDAVKVADETAWLLKSET